MIINFNITKNTTLDEVRKLAAELTEEFQNEIPDDGNAAYKTLVFYSMLGANLVTMFAVNKAINDKLQTGSNEYDGAAEVIKEISNDMLNHSKMMLNSVTNGTARERTL